MVRSTALLIEKGVPLEISCGNMLIEVLFRPPKVSVFEIIVFKNNRTPVPYQRVSTAKW